MCDEQRLRSACAYAQSDQSICSSLDYSTSVKLRTEHHLEFLSLKGGCTGSSESTLVKMPRCWKSHFYTVPKHLKTSFSHFGKLQQKKIIFVFVKIEVLTGVTSSNQFHPSWIRNNTKQPSKQTWILLFTRQYL